MRAARVSGPMWLYLILFVYLVSTAESQTYLICKKPQQHKCIVWRFSQEENMVETFTDLNNNLNCGFTSVNPRKFHRKFISIELINTGLTKSVFCKRIEEGGELNQLHLLELAGLSRSRRQATFTPRGRYRGQTQSQYLSIDRGGKDEGKAEAHSAADTSRASVSGSSGMGQAQSQSIYDPSCDDCYGKSPQEVESLRRDPYGPGGFSSGRVPGGYNNGFPGKVSSSPGQSRYDTNQAGLPLGPDRQGGSGVGNVNHPGNEYGPRNEYGTVSEYGPGNKYGPGNIYGPGSEYGPGNKYTPGSAYGPGNKYGPGSEYGPGNKYGPGSEYGPGNKYGPGREYGPGSKYGPGSEFGPENKYGSGNVYGPGNKYDTINKFGPGSEYDPGNKNGPEGKYVPGSEYGNKHGPNGVGTLGQYGPGSNLGNKHSDTTYIPGTKDDPKNNGFFAGPQGPIGQVPNLNAQNGQNGNIPPINNVYQGYKPGVGIAPNYGTQTGFTPGQPGNINGQPIGDKNGYMPSFGGNNGAYGPTNNRYNGPGQRPGQGYQDVYPGQGQTKPSSEYNPIIGPSNGNFIPTQSNNGGYNTKIPTDQIGTDRLYNPVTDNRNGGYRPQQGELAHGQGPSQGMPLHPGQLSVPMSGNIPSGQTPDVLTSTGSNTLTPSRNAYPSTGSPQNGYPSSINTNSYPNQNTPALGQGNQQYWPTASGPYPGPGGNNYFCCVVPDGKTVPGSIYPNNYGIGPTTTLSQNVPNNLSPSDTGSYKPGAPGQNTQFPTDSGQQIPGTTYSGHYPPGFLQTPSANGNINTPNQQGTQFSPGSQGSYNIPGNIYGVNNPTNTNGASSYNPNGIDTMGQHGPNNGLPNGNNGVANLAVPEINKQYNRGNQGGPGETYNKYVPGADADTNYPLQFPATTGPSMHGIGPNNQGTRFDSTAPGQKYGNDIPINPNEQGTGIMGNFNRPYGNVPNTNDFRPPGQYGADGTSPGNYNLGSKSSGDPSQGGVPGGQTVDGNGVTKNQFIPGGNNLPSNFGTQYGPTQYGSPGVNNQQDPRYNGASPDGRPNLPDRSFIGPQDGLGTGNGLDNRFNTQDGNNNMGVGGKYPYGERGSGNPSGFGEQPRGPYDQQKSGSGQFGPGTQGIGAQTGSGNGYNEVPQNYVDPNAAILDGDDSQAEAVVSQAANGTIASASSKGGNDKERAQTHVQGTYTGSGSFEAQAQIAGENKEAQSEVSGGKKGASSSATGSGRNNKSQANVQLGSETGSVQTQSQSSGALHSSNSQVQGSVKGGMADAQARGPGSTSSQAQIGFTPYKDGEKSHDLQKSPFVGGGMATAQSSGRTGQSQSQLHGTFKYGISYNGAAQSGASLDKDAVFPNRLSYDKIDVFDEKEKNINVDITEGPDTKDKASSVEPEPLPELPIEDQATTEKPVDETLTNSESRYGTHPHSEHHALETTQAPSGPVSGSTRSFTNNNNNGADYEYTKEGNQPFEYDEGFPYAPDGSDDLRDYSNYDEYARETPTHQSLKASNKTLDVQQSTGGNTQHILLGTLKDHDAEITQKQSERPNEERIYQPGESIPGTGGYTIPIGFTGSVKSVASKDKTYVVGSRGSPSQAQSVTLTPGTGRLKYNPPSLNKYVRPKNLRSLHGKDDDRYVSVSKSVTRSLDNENNIRKQYSHTYYTKSSSCGYFTFTCTMVSSAEGKKKVCKPKIPTNPDGTPIRC